MKQSRSWVLLGMALLVAACGAAPWQEDKKDSQPEGSKPADHHLTADIRFPATVTFSCDGNPISTFDSHLNSDPEGKGIQAWGAIADRPSTGTACRQGYDLSASIYRQATSETKTLQLKVASNIVCTSNVPMIIQRGAEYACSGPFDGVEFGIGIKVLP